MLYFRYGVMNASKTADLLMTAHNLNSKGKAVLVVKSALDTRSSFLESRTGMFRAADIVANPTTDLSFLSSTSPTPVSAIFVDEVQFFTRDQINQLRDVANAVDVFCYGLRTDYRCLLFPASLRLFEVADVVKELHSSCELCDRTATVNAKFANDIVVRDGSPQFDVGGEEKYKSLCWSCWSLSPYFPTLTALRESRSKKNS